MASPRQPRLDGRGCGGGEGYQALFAAFADDPDGGRVEVDVGQVQPGHANRRAAQRAAETEASMNRLRVDMANAHAAKEAATVRADAAERLLDQARTELQTERNRYDVSLSQLHDQLAQLIARNPPRRAPTKTIAKRPAPSS